MKIVMLGAPGAGKGTQALNIAKEYGIKDEDIIGVLTAFVRKGKTISVNNRRYRAYCHIWVGIYPLRMFMKKVTGKLRRMLKRILQ